MTEYDVWLYKDKAVQIHRTQIKCDRRDVPGQVGLHRAGLPEERPVSGHHAGHGQRRLESIPAYLIQSNGTDVKVYHQVFQCNMEGVEE